MLWGTLILAIFCIYIIYDYLIEIPEYKLCCPRCLRRDLHKMGKQFDYDDTRKLIDYDILYCRNCNCRLYVREGQICKWEKDFPY